MSRAHAVTPRPGEDIVRVRRKSLLYGVQVPEDYQGHRCDWRRLTKIMERKRSEELVSNGGRWWI